MLRIANAQWKAERLSLTAQAADLRERLLRYGLTVLVSGVNEFDSGLAIASDGGSRIEIEKRSYKLPPVVLEDPDFELFEVGHGREGGVASCEY